MIRHDNLVVVGVGLGDADAFISGRHRHDDAPRDALFALGARRRERLVGVVIVGRPVPPAVDDGHTVEVTRACADDPDPEAALYRAAWLAAGPIGCRIIVTPTQPLGIKRALRAAGLVPAATLPPALPRTPRRTRRPTAASTARAACVGNRDTHSHDEQSTDREGHADE